MKIINLLLILILISIPASGLAEGKLRNNLISDVTITDLLDQDQNSKISSVVVGYDSAVTDYAVGASLAVLLTAINRESLNIQLTCDISIEKTTFVPAMRMIPFKTDMDVQGENRILIGGPFSNNEVIEYKEVNELLKEPGDMVIKRFGNDIVIAGYTAFDTQRAVNHLKTLILSK